MTPRHKGKVPADEEVNGNDVDFNNIIKANTKHKKRDEKGSKVKNGITSETSKKNNTSANKDTSKTKVNNASEQTLAAILGEGKKKDVKITQKTVTVKHKTGKKGKKASTKKIVKKVVIKKRHSRKKQEESEDLPPIIIKKHRKRTKKQPKKKVITKVVVKKRRSSKKEPVEEPAQVIKRVKKHRKSTAPKKRTVVRVIINRINPSNGKLEQVTETISREEAELRMQSENMKIVDDSSSTKSSSSRSSSRKSSEASSNASQDVIRVRKRKHHSTKKVVNYITVIKKRINPITGREEEYEDRVAVQDDSDDDISESEVKRPAQYDGVAIKISPEDLKGAPPQTADPHSEDLVLQIATEAAAEADEAGCSLAELLERKPFPQELKAAVLRFYSQRVSELKEMTRPPPLKRYTRSFGIRAEM